MRLIILLLLASPLSAVIAPTPQPNRPIVSITNGTLAGTIQDNHISVFRGIPFAAPPVGKLRWREPQPAANWSGTRDATQPGNSCTQPPAGLDAYIAPLAATYETSYPIQSYPSSEDCLYLNVFSPWPIAAQGLPVMVWLHGGSNRVGTGAGESYDGSSLATRGVIVVTINYRLGVMGFFSHPELSAESAHHSTGNYGLLDQIEALRWVQQNIAQFGGDSANVTLFGESAGSIDATMLMASPLANGLFRRVIAESGPAFGLGPTQTLADAEAVGAALGQSVAATNALAGMVSIHAHTMLAATPQRTALARCTEPTPTIAPVIVWVVETGMPNPVARNRTNAPPVSAQNPPTGFNLVMR